MNINFDQIFLCNDNSIIFLVQCFLKFFVVNDDIYGQLILHHTLPNIQSPQFFTLHYI